MPLAGWPEPRMMLMNSSRAVEEMPGDCRGDCCPFPSLDRCDKLRRRVTAPPAPASSGLALRWTKLRRSFWPIEGVRRRLTMLAR